MKSKQVNQRRSFLKSSIAFGAMAVAPQLLQAKLPERHTSNNDGEGFTFLFQGDSITDGNRTRNTDWNHVMGHGYQYLIASRLWYNFPEKGFHFFNRGISGNKITDLSSRWQNDTLSLTPDLLSILIGINDTAAFVNGDENYSAVRFETGYRALLQQTKQQLPHMQLVLCEPFVLHVGAIKEKWDVYSSEVEKRQQVVKRLAAEFDGVFIGFQAAFNEALSKAPAEYWIWDGIHPMPAGHELMARKWIADVSKKVKFIK